LDFFSLSPTRIEKEDCLYDLILGWAGKYLPKLWARKQSQGVVLKPLTPKGENTYFPPREFSCAPSLLLKNKMRIFLTTIVFGRK